MKMAKLIKKQHICSKINVTYQNILCILPNMKTAHQKPNIYDYINFREYLKDHLSYVRSTDGAFSFQILIDKYGLRSRSHFIDIINGRKLTDKFIASYQSICELTGSAAEYFQALVGYDQAKKDSDKLGCFATILRLSPNLETIKLENEAYRYFSKWYYPAILSLLDVHKRESDHRKIAKLLRPEISAVQARHAIKTLTELGFIGWDKRRKEWHFNHKFFKCTETAKAVAIKGFHEAVLHMGAEAYKNDFENQTFSTLTLSTSLKKKN
jgi:uncharacterized protein (TIGR02147 family)